MKVSLLQEHLMPQLVFVGKNISFKTQLPITQHVLLMAEKGRLRLATTNIETTTATEVAVKSEKDGGICVPSKLFIEFVSSLPQGKIDLEAKEQVLSVTSRGYKATLPGIGAGEFPPVPKKKKKGVIVKTKEFVRAVKSVLFAAATDEGRPLLTGVKIKKTGDQTLFVATDGYRLSLKRTTLPLKDGFDRVIPGRALFHVLQTGEEGELEFGEVDDGQTGFFIGDNEVYTRVIEGEYPAFDRIIPKTNSTSVVLEKEIFTKAVKTAAIFARDNANIVKIHFEGKSMAVSANTPQVGESKVDVDVDVKGDGGDIAFNSRFLLDFLNNVEGEKLVFEMTGSLNPGVFKIEGDDSFLHIIMPVRVQG
jgi:DNA polymerase-3 subunit beta